jgi:hypothetical protein
MQPSIRFYWDLEFVSAHNPDVDPLALVRSSCASIVWSLNELFDAHLAPGDCLVETSSRHMGESIRYSFHLKIKQHTIAASNLHVIKNTVHWIMAQLEQALLDPSHPLAPHAPVLLVCPGKKCAEKTWIFDTRAYMINYASLRTLFSRKKQHALSCKRLVGPVTSITAADLQPAERCEEPKLDAWFDSLVSNVARPARLVSFPRVTQAERGRMMLAKS